MVERAPLRPVPRRPGGSVEPIIAVRHVAARLPGLDPAARDALALVTLAGRTRAEAAARVELPESELAAALGRGRKALRRATGSLAGSGWCERAELLISDRLDGELDERGAARLDVHLRNCPRCVEHERRLVTAIDALLAAASPEAAPEPGPDPADAPRAPLRLADPRAERHRAPSLGKAPIASRPFGEPVAPARPGQRIEPPIQPPGQPSDPIQPPQQPPEQPPVEPPQPPGPEPAPPSEPPEQPIEPPARPPEPAQEQAIQIDPRIGGKPGELPSERLPQQVGAAAVEPTRRSVREATAAITWQVLYALAAICAIAMVAITVWGAASGEL